MTRVLITGGAGFIGSHAADALLAAGYEVRLLDNLSPQVHGGNRQRPAYLAKDAELVVGDVTDALAVDHALRGTDMVLHLASAVGVGQSMYDIEPYVRTNELGTAVLLQALSKRPVARLVVASSMSIYGEGLYRSADQSVVACEERAVEQLRRGDWELRDAAGNPLDPVPTPETKQPSLSSIYALNKYAQERMCLITGKAYGIPTVALRFFNAFGPRQALSNPYTGVLAIFAARLLNGRPPLVFEDGRQRRDFVHVHDVARACRMALEAEHAQDVFNVGSGQSRTILSVAEDLAEVMGRRDIAPELTRKYRAGDIRHCFADMGKSRDVLGFEPRVAFRDGLEELAEYLADQIADDQAERATKELQQRGLVA
ncbi:dTDP-L-rhamnose 4-epimerase [Bradyrhizobium sp. GM2.2]|jgi:dTDP-L-rhamnose 4-epimerase|uniref:NAD-dependent epimerase/dehydratase family protein n=1 Tax=Bradyrhizobium TaxID=374 RepID=UPI0003A3BB11|nr:MULTISPECIES: NAD-dependent epimerase/dehydratase family protein [Bradyrhizobium]MBM7484357.1 dTDP-L-rhamnose 4-epimerase [Bradyrhizobium canariense]MCK1309761.1 NAD-dependent epimerase/dehydratase family protein [Bradyrhizobium sp. 45]MCK1312825.1 NAD-dependent epimerase/dehydratase family protein [Bradyrhizobium sp. 23]MCK1321310.1 NAD-dependent epimerase/dehydratase family protein [Bradyrhizobium sp. 156]MCK1329320.1 NAD-dependent epimerase/dehydratase family protein [Bradyrhizobium sp. 